MADWPTAEEFAAWVDPNNATVDPADPRVVEGLAAAVGMIRDALWVDLLPSGSLDDVPDQVRTASFILTNRYYRRPDSPLGKVGSAEFMQDIRRTDPDVHGLISQYVVPDGADVTADTVDDPTAA